MPRKAGLEVVRTPRQAAALLDPTRRSLLERLAEPASAASLSRKMGLPRQRLNYHLRELERDGLVELVEERRKGNCTERLVRATARAYLISPEALGALGAGTVEVRDRFSATYLIAVAARAIRDLAVLRSRAETAGRRLATLTLETEIRFRSAADRNAFAEELAFEIGRLSAKYHDEGTEGGRVFRFVLGAYPALTKEDDSAAEPPQDKETKP
jgi:DNA-binding transcriptional ArsR family regulator